MKSLRVLIVEDDAIVAALLAETLEACGHSICGIETSEASAVTAAARERPELIIIDVGLTPGSGIAAIAEIDRAGPVPHVFISGERLEQGPEILLKPFRMPELLLAMKRALAVVAYSVKTKLGRPEKCVVSEAGGGQA